MKKYDDDLVMPALSVLVVNGEWIVKDGDHELGRFSTSRDAWAFVDRHSNDKAETTYRNVQSAVIDKARRLSS